MPETKKLSKITHTDNGVTMVETFTDGTHEVKHAEDGSTYGPTTSIGAGHTHEEIIEQYKYDGDSVTKLIG